MSQMHRRQSEEIFHDKWAESIDLNKLLVHESFEAITAVENKYALEMMGDLKNKTILDVGSGAGESSVYFALQGANVTALDISQKMLNIASNLANKHGVIINTIREQTEKMSFTDNTFDLVYGNGVLHHVDFELSLKEVFRILKPGGKAIFIEPLAYNPIIKIYRYMARDVRSEHETPLIFSKLNLVKSIYKRIHHREFWLSTLLILIGFYVFEGVHPSKERYWKKIIYDADKYKKSFMALKKIDDFVLKWLPFLRPFCWNTVLVFEKQ
ncbi:MAG: SAM-dependent methyltransferase [Flavobacterium sp.]|nr:SAM-dependent methyltransferase [Flavobacterium sp.]